jgi:hypothetical protein
MRWHLNATRRIMKAEHMKQEIIDAKGPQWLRKAFEKVDLKQRWKVINLHLQEHQEEIYELLTYKHSKMRPQKRFEGIFNCDGMEF